MPLYLKNPRLPPQNYRGRRTYFITICCAERHPVFSDIPLAQAVLSQLAARAAYHSFSIHSFCLMPDHLHFVAEGMEDTCDLVKFVNDFKQRTSYEYRQSHRRQLWQTRFHDHILRRADAVEDVACYIWMNPVRKGLCTAPSLYLLSGSQTIEWMKRCFSGTAWTPPWKADTPG
jgi:REP element-mobilizing transposase RayT